MWVDDPVPRMTTSGGLTGGPQILSGSHTPAVFMFVCARMSVCLCVCASVCVPLCVCVSVAVCLCACAYADGPGLRAKIQVGSNS